MIVLSTAVPATESVVVAPIKVMALETVRVEVQLAVPAGTTTVSPSTAEDTAVVTSAREGLNAVIEAARAEPETTKNSVTRSGNITESRPNKNQPAKGARRRRLFD